MAIKIALLAALCAAQVFAFRPAPAAFVRDVVCKNPAGEVTHTFEEAVNEIDQVRETVSMTAMDAYAKGNNFEVIIACLRAQEESYVKLGERISEMVRDAAQELAVELQDKAEKYGKLLEAPLKTIALTIRSLPEKVYNYLKNQEFLKAMEVMMESRRIVEENGKIVAEVMQKMVEEVPELAERTEEIAREINKEAKQGSEAIRKAFEKCVEEGGPKKISSEE